MITEKIILELHKESIDAFGGSHGVRDEGLMLSAIARPYQTFDGEALYTSVFERSAAIAESLIVNHPFVDGNKRTGFLAMLALLEMEGFKLIASQDDAYAFTISISTGSISFDQIVAWLKANTAAI
jgi:death-on-curing protein